MWRRLCRPGVDKLLCVISWGVVKSSWELFLHNSVDKTPNRENTSLLVNAVCKFFPEFGVYTILQCY